MLVARRRLLRIGLAIIDTLTLAAALLVAFAASGPSFHREFLSLTRYAWLLAAIVIIWPGCLNIFGLYQSAAYNSMRRTLTSLLQAHSLASLLLSGLMYVAGSEAALESFLVLSLIFLTIQKFAAVWYLERALQRADIQRRKVVLVSDPEIAQCYLHMMRRRFSALADVVRVVTPGPIKSQRSALVAADAPLDSIDDLPALLEAEVIDEVIAVAPIDHAALEKISRWCAIRGVLVRVWFQLPCPVIGHWAAEYFGDGAFLVSLAAIPQNPVFLLLKRVIDVIGAAIGMIFCGIVYLCYGPRLQRESGGSSIFRQQRIGRNGRAFTLYKFRTMGVDAEQQKASISYRNEMHGPMFKVRKDPRVTNTGRKLRRRHLDELPQFWNVLRGEMSLVGTRPPTPDETAVYQRHHHRRLSIKPGITGLWQLNGNGAVKEFEEVVKLDCDYIDRCSLRLDARILTETVKKVIRGEGW